MCQPSASRAIDPKTVPAGQYAEESLRSLGLLDALRPRFILAENVRQALEYVARGEVDAGFDAGQPVEDSGIPDAGPPPELRIRRLLPPRGSSSGGTPVLLEGSGFLRNFAPTGSQASSGSSP